MMQLKKYIPVTLMLWFSVLLFSGCKANLEWYVRNLSGKEVKLVLRYETKEPANRHAFLPLKRNFVDYKQEIVKIDYITRQVLRDSLPLIQLDYSTYELTIPAGSTVELTSIIPTDYAYDRNVVAEFYQEGKVYAINTSSVFGKNSDLKTTGGMTLKNLVYYDYGKPVK